MLIGLAGKKGSGKSTISKIICDKHNAIELAFADRLKEICSIVYNVPIDYFYNPKLKNKIIEKLNITSRKLMQIIGMKYREIGHDIPELTVKNPWIYNVEEKIREIHENKEDTLIVISDVRFQDEHDMIKKNGGIIIKIIRPSLNNEQSNETSNHISENSMDSFELDHIIYNSSTIELLSVKVYKLVDDLLKD